MGLLSSINAFLKALFGSSKSKKEEVPPKQKLTLSELKSWISTKEKESLSLLEKKWSIRAQELQNQIQKINEAITALKSAKPRLPELYNQNKALADGNRNTYVNACEIFLKTLDLNFPIDGLPYFEKNFEEAFTKFMAENERAFAITKEFFTEESVYLKDLLQELYNLLTKLKSDLSEAKLNELVKVKQLYESLSLLMDQKALLTSELAQIEQKIKTIESEFSEISNKLSKINESSEMVRLKELEKEIEEKSKKLKDLELEIYSLFSDIDAPLRKLAWQKPEYKGFIESYVNSPISSVLHDSDFKFESVLIALRIAIESNGIVVGDKKRTKILTTISSFLNDHYLQDWAAKYSQLKTEADNLKKQLQGFEALSQIQSLEKKKEELDKLKVNLQKKKEKIQKKIEKIETESLFSQLSEGLAQLGISLASEVKAEVNPQN